jgi:hypothetical protein
MSYSDFTSKLQGKKHSLESHILETVTFLDLVKTKHNTYMYVVFDILGNYLEIINILILSKRNTRSTYRHKRNIL